MKNQTKEKEVKTKLVEPSKSETKLDAKNIEIVKRESVKKFANINYELMTAKEQKRLRTEKRSKLFKIINAYHLLSLKKEQTEQTKKESFEAFKAFIKECYLIPLSECENVFKGTNQKKIDFDLYIKDLKEYLNTDIKKIKK